MNAVTHDTTRRTTGVGLGLAITSALSFGLSGSLARGLMDAGWSAAAAVAVRVTIAAAVLIVPGLFAVRGRWNVLTANLRTIALYGLLAVAGAQLLYFLAVSRLDVGVALLIEYTAPVAVVAFLWLVRGQRPGPLTFVGAAIAAGGLVLLLDLIGGAEVDAVGVLFALGAMIGAGAYFIISADDTSGLPPITLAAGGLVFAAICFWLAAVVGVLPVTMTDAPVAFTFGTVLWWVPVLALGLVTAALAYVTGIGAARRLGSRVASFVALSEVAAGLGFAWLLLDQQPRAVQLLGALLVLVGVVIVKLGERDVRTGAADGGIDDLFVEVVPGQHLPAPSAPVPPADVTPPAAQRP
jgi:drug/metabolite transporter (DMT)-like permease